MKLNDTPTEDFTSIDVKLLLYSKKVIIIFSFLFSSVFGAVLLMHTLRDIGKSKVAYLILLGSIVYTILSIIIIFIPEKPIIPLIYLFNLAGGFIIAGNVYKIYIPHSEYHRRKKIWKPLIISIILSIPLLLEALFNLAIEL